MANVFNSVEGLHPRRNAFSAHTYRNDFTAQLGVNLPVYLQHVPPASRIKVSCSALVRLQALIAPIMDNIDFYVHFWQIPYRLLENDRFTAFISGENPAEEYDALFATPFEFAQAVFEKSHFTLETDYYSPIFANGGIMDFLGYDSALFPVVKYDSLDDEYYLDGGNNTTKFNFRGLFAYYMLHLNWYMNENVPYFEGNGVDLHPFTELVDKAIKDQDLDSLAELAVQSVMLSESSFLPHGWEKDYFTSALPNVQFGDPVTLPMAGTAPVTLASGGNTEITIGKVSAGIPYLYLHTTNDVGDDANAVFEYANSQGDGKLVDADGGVLDSLTGTLRTALKGTADLSEATAISINELRFANALQKFKERQLRFGRRRLEYYKGFFDVTPEDLRLQVPKYLGGGRIPINITDIEQTSATDGSQALGHLAGKATAVAGGFAGFKTFCSEETLIIGIAFAMPHITYCQHTSKFLLKTNDIYDYFNPSFEHLGEQAIKKIELYAGTNTPDSDFGYTPRYNEYRFHLNEMHGEFKDTLAFWTLGRIFDGTPALNPQFIYMQPKNFDRIFAVSGQAPMLVSMLFRTRIIQPVSKYGTPMLLA